MLAGTAVVSYFLVASNVALAMPLTLVGALGGLALVLVATFGRKQDNPAIVLSYAALEGLFLGAISFVLANFTVASANAGVLIGEAILGTMGVFFGMLVVYKTGPSGSPQVHPNGGRCAVRRAGLDARQPRAGDVQCRRR